MERFVRGDIIVLSFPFTDLSATKKRPALVLRKLAGLDYLLCQITTNSFAHSEEISLNPKDFIQGRLKKDSFIRFTKLFTAEESIIHYRAGKVSHQKIQEVVNSIHKFIS